MKRVLRLSLHYWPALLASVLLMAVVGLCQASMALLIKPLLDRVLNPAAGDSGSPFVEVPIVGWQIHLENLLPAQIHNVWITVLVFEKYVTRICSLSASDATWWLCE